MIIANTRAITRFVATVLLLAGTSDGCTSGGADDSWPDGGGGYAPHDDAGGAGGTAGDAGSAAMGGSGGSTPGEDAGPTFALPAGCAPADMRFLCNPLTNEGCATGEACDYGLDEYFQCFPGPNDVDEGGACDLEAGPFCKAGWTCDTPTPDETSGVCHRHCCSDGDCPAPQTCATFEPEFGTLGVCH